MILLYVDKVFCGTKGVLVVLELFDSFYQVRECSFDMCYVSFTNFDDFHASIILNVENEFGF